MNSVDRTARYVIDCLQNAEFEKVYSLLKPHIHPLFQKSARFLEEANWEGIVEICLFMFIHSFSLFYLELYPKGNYYFVNVHYSFISHFLAV